MRMPCFLRSSLVIAVAAAATTLAAGQPADPPPPSASFEVYWYVHAVSGSGWADNFDFRGIPVNQHMAMTSVMGLYPRAGPQDAVSDPTWLSRHLAGLARDVPLAIPDPNFDGPVAIDWEDWMPTWRHNLDPIHQRWRTYIRAARPQLLAGLSAEQQERVFQTTFEEAACEILKVSIEECRRIRPRAKWGYFSMPVVAYWDSMSNKLHEVREANDRLQPLWDACDVLFPGCYQGYEADPTLPPREDWNRAMLTDQTWRNTPEEAERWLFDYVTEAVRLARGKPVYAFLWSRYMPRSPDDPAPLRLVNDINLRIMFEVPKVAGASGVVLWDYFYTQQQALEFRDFFDRKLGPRILAVLSPTDRSNINYRVGLIYRTPDGRTLIVRDDPPPAPSQNQPARRAGDTAPAVPDTNPQRDSTPPARSPRPGPAPRLTVLPPSAPISGADARAFPAAIPPAPDRPPAGDAPIGNASPRTSPPVVVRGSSPTPPTGRDRAASGAPIEIPSQRIILDPWRGRPRLAVIDS
jgi:hypothetical protein